MKHFILKGICFWTFMSNCSIYCLSAAENKLCAVSGGLEAADLKYLALQPAREAGEASKATEFTLYYYKTFKQEGQDLHVCCPNVPRDSQLCKAGATRCPNHSGHTWSQLPSCIFTGTEPTRKVWVIWNQIHDPWHGHGRHSQPLCCEQPSSLHPVLSQTFGVVAFKHFLSRSPFQQWITFFLISFLLFNLI